MRFYTPFALALTLLFFWSIPVSSAEKKDTVLESISFAGDTDKGENIKFKLNEEHIPKIFTIQDANPRLVLDFLDARCSSQVNRNIDTKGKIVKRIRVGIHTDNEPKIRVVVDLASNGGYQHKYHFDAQEKTLVVSIFSAKDDASHKEKKEGKTEAAQEPEVKKTAPIAQKEQAQLPKVAEKKPGEKGSDKKVENVAKVAPGKTTDKKEETSATVGAPVPGKSDTVTITPAPAPSNKEATPVVPKQEEGGGGLSEQAVPETSKPEQTAVMGRPADKPSPDAGAEQLMPEVTGAKKPAVAKQEKEAPKAVLPDKDKKTAAKEDKSAGKKAEPILSNVTFENASNKGEMVLFKLNGFYPPTVFGIEKGEPKVVCDFLNTHLAENVKEVLRCNGRYVESVRVTKQTKPNKIRVVLSLVPSKNYDLQQVFFKEDNLFVIIVNSQDSLPAGTTTATH